MSSKLLIALLAVIVVAAGAGAYIAFSGDDTGDGKDADDSGPGDDSPSDPGSRTFDFKTPQIGDWITQEVTGTWLGDPVDMDFKYTVTDASEYEITVRITLKTDGQPERVFQEAVYRSPDEFELLPIGMLDYAPTELGGLEKQELISASSAEVTVTEDVVLTELLGEPVGSDIVDTPRGEILCNHYFFETINPEYGVEVKVDFWFYPGTALPCKMVEDIDGNVLTYVMDSNLLVESTEEGGSDTPGEPGTDEPGTDDPSQPGTDDPGTDTPDEPSGGDRTFVMGEPQVGDWISGNMTEEYEGVTTESAIMFRVTAVEGDAMTIEVTMTEEGTVLESNVIVGLPTSIFETLGLVYFIGVGDGGDGDVEPVLVGSEITETSRGEVLCDRYALDGGRLFVDYWNFHGTEFTAKIVISETGQSSNQGIVVFDSNRLVETS